MCHFVGAADTWVSSEYVVAGGLVGILRAFHSVLQKLVNKAFKKRASELLVGYNKEVRKLYFWSFRKSHISFNRIQLLLL